MTSTILPVCIQLSTRSKGHIWGHFTPLFFKIPHGYLIICRTNPDSTHDLQIPVGMTLPCSATCCPTVCTHRTPTNSLLLCTLFFSTTGSTAFSEGKSPHHHLLLEPLHNPPEHLVVPRIYFYLNVYARACLSIIHMFAVPTVARRWC